MFFQRIIKVILDLYILHSSLNSFGKQENEFLNLYAGLHLVIQNIFRHAAPRHWQVLGQVFRYPLGKACWDCLPELLGYTSDCSTYARTVEDINLNAEITTNCFTIKLIYFCGHLIHSRRQGVKHGSIRLYNTIDVCIFLPGRC